MQYLQKGRAEEFVNFRRPRNRLGIFSTTDLRFLLSILYPTQSIHECPKLSMVTGRVALEVDYRRGSSCKIRAVVTENIKA